MRLVLVTGAGASRDLGKEEPLPLMDTWSNLLCEALDRRESNLAAAIGLKPGLSGPDFERALGDFLRWQDMRHLEAKFAGLGGPHPGSSFGEQQRARENQDGRVEAVTRVLRASLFDNFGAHRVDSKRAASAYGGLLDKVARDISLVCATTNYDLSLGMALRTSVTRHTLALQKTPSERLGCMPTDSSIGKRTTVSALPSCTFTEPWAGTSRTEKSCGEEATSPTTTRSASPSFSTPTLTRIRPAIPLSSRFGESFEKLSTTRLTS